MLNVEKKSILSMLEFELVSISHFIKIANYQYYLVEMVDMQNEDEKVYTWEEISVIKSRFNLFEEDIEKYKQFGTQLQKVTKWPALRVQALKQIKQKFWGEPVSKVQNNKYDFQEEINIQNQVKEIQIRRKQKQQRKQRKQRKQRAQISKTISQNIEQEQLDVRFDSDDEIDKPPESQQKSQQTAQAYKIKKVRLEPRKGKINYVVQDNSGKQKSIRNQVLKKTHLYQVIQFLQHELGIKQ